MGRKMSKDGQEESMQIAKQSDVSDNLQRKESPVCMREESVKLAKIIYLSRNIVVMY